jgi:hypothetical protein
MIKTFDHLLLLGRPASGKSEFIDFMKKVPDDVRARKYHIGRFEEVDDFVWIWEKFMEDDLWEKAGYDRLYSKQYMPGNPGLSPEGERLFDFCMQKFNDVITKKYLKKDRFYDDGTLFVEFARGRKNAFRKSLGALEPEILRRSAILFIYVTMEESWRRNVARYQEKLKHSILAHMVPKETFDYYYSEHDWLDLTDEKPAGHIQVGGLKIPFVTMNNEPESTDPVILEKRYGDALNKLYGLCYEKSV